jgi:hypothetical protein
MDRQTSKTPTIDLIYSLKENVKDIFSSEYALLKFEMSDRLEAGKSVLMLVLIGSIFGLLAGFMALVAFAKGITALGVPEALSYAIVALFAGTLALMLLRVSQQRVKERIFTPIKFKKG